MLETAVAERIVKPARNLTGTLRLPGDKSISHRYAMLAGLAEGTSTFSNFSTGADCASSLRCVAALGAKVEWLPDGQPPVTWPSPESAAFFRPPMPRSIVATPAQPCA